VLDLNALGEDADADPSNELVQSFGFDPATNALTLTDAGGSFVLDLNALGEDADADPSNELVQSFGFNPATNALTLADAGGSYVLDLNALGEDADADASNELIEAGSLSVSSAGVLALTEAGISHQVDLSIYLETAIASSPSGGWEVNTSDNRVYNTTSSIGIGTDIPTAKLETRSSGTAGERTFRASRSNGISLLEIADDVITASSQSEMRIQGQLRYRSVTYQASNFVNTVYSVQPDIHYIVCSPASGSSGNRFINLPSAATNIGRVIKIIKASPFNSNGDVFIQCATHNINYSNANIQLVDQGITSVTFLSIGADGWIVSEYSEFD
jgi:hypothetical protein